MKDVEIIKSIRIFVVNRSDDDDVHGFAHIQRVYDLCDKIGIELKANMLILRISALLHDIGRNKEISNTINKNHAILSAEISKDYLKAQLFGLSEDEINQIIHCILAHSFSNKINPLTLEAKILSDADKLDALGAVGLYRTIIYSYKLVRLDSMFLYTNSTITRQNQVFLARAIIHPSSLVNKT